MGQSRVVAQAIFASYFVVILTLFWFILSTLRRTTQSQRAVLFFLLAAGSLCHTWFYMIQFLVWSFHDFETHHPATYDASFVDRATQWLMGSELFEQAWRRVCEGPLNWWWSEQLCIFTVGVWVTFLFVQGSRYRVKYVWAYMLLGQLVAISVASNLFYAAISLSQTDIGRATKEKEKEKSIKPTIPLSVSIPVLLSHLTILVSPMVAHPDSAWFLPNLLVMHTIIFIPLIDIPSRPNLSGMNSRTFYQILAVLGLVLRTRTYFSLPRLSGLPSDLWATLHSHPAQSSIGYDVLWTIASFAIYCSNPSSSLLACLVSPALALYVGGRQD